MVGARRQGRSSARRSCFHVKSGSQARYDVYQGRVASTRAGSVGGRAGFLRCTLKGRRLDVQKQVWR